MTRKFSLLTAVVLPLVPASILACGGDDGGKITVKPDAAGSGSGSGSGSAVTCPAPESYGTPTTFAMQGTKYVTTSGSAAGSNEHTLRWTGYNADGTAIRVLLFGNCGSGSSGDPLLPGCEYHTPTWPGAYTPVSGIDLATNGDAAILVLANLNSAMTQFQDLYISTAGTLNVTQVANGSGQTFAGNAVNVETVHLNADGTDVNADGCTSSIASLTWSGSAAATGKNVQVEYIDASSKEEAVRKYLSRRHY